MSLDPMSFDVVPELEQCHYNLNDACDVVWEFISEDTKTNMSRGDIAIILNEENKHLESVGVIVDEEKNSPLDDFPIDYDQDKADDAIRKECLKQGVIISKTEYENIMEAELIYYRKCGALDDYGAYVN